MERENQVLFDQLAEDNWLLISHLLDASVVQATPT